jgi:hypothetical protein
MAETRKYKNYIVNYSMREFQLIGHDYTNDSGISFSSPQGFKMLSDFETNFCPVCGDYPCTCNK